MSHLGARGSQCRPDLLDFPAPASHDADTILFSSSDYRRMAWALHFELVTGPQSHNDFVQKMLPQAAQGAPKVIYVPRQPCEFLPEPITAPHFGGIDFVENTIHTGGQRQALSGDHGDYFRPRGAKRALASPISATRPTRIFAIRLNRSSISFRKMFGVPFGGGGGGSGNVAWPS